MIRSATFTLLYFLVLALTTSSCADAVKEGIKDFKSANKAHDAGLSNADIDNIPIEFEDLGAGIAGLCLVFTGGVDPEISLDNDFMGSAEFADQVATVMHELGHCALGRDHWTVELSDRPESLMFPSISEDMNYDDHKSDYQEEMMTNTDEFGGIF